MNKIELCKKIQANIYNLCPNEIDELFKILHKNNSTYTQNNNGIFVNLNWVDEDILIQINNYINFCLKSQTEINKYEIMRNLLNNSINNKEKTDDIQENISNTTNDAKNKLNILPVKQKISSSMKFYLLKKKFFKQNCVSNIYTTDNTLTQEDFIIS
jgi:hypothetical protein